MEAYFQALGSHLIEACKASNDDELLLIAAPFIKREALERVITSCSQEQQIQVITRWNLNEIAAGASDPDIWELLKDRPYSSLWLRSDLHAKYYRFGNSCYVGSANITDAALGWRTRSNFEFLMRVSFTENGLADFEEALWKNCTEVSDDIYNQLNRLIAEFSQLDDKASIREGEEYRDTVLPDIVSEHESEFAITLLEEERERWIPHLRHPEELYRVYAGDLESLTTVTRRHGIRDLQHFEIPAGLSETAFNIEIGWQLLQMPIVRKVDEFVYRSRRFGAVRDYLKTLPCSETPDFDATESWQTLMRWLLHFLEDRYDRRVANYSEIFVRKV